MEPPHFDRELLCHLESSQVTSPFIMSNLAQQPSKFQFGIV
jgi:hypothetical protein